MVKTYLALLRIALGFVFLWAFVDKVFGLGFATSPERAWLAGGSPTTGYLSGATHGPFAQFFQSLAGNPVVDWLFMLGLLGIGVAFVLGIAMRFAAYSGALMLALMYLSAFPPANNPVVDDHLVYAVLMLVLPELKVGETLGLGKSWQKSDLAKKYPILR